MYMLVFCFLVFSLLLPVCVWSICDFFSVWLPDPLSLSLSLSLSICLSRSLSLSLSLSPPLPLSLPLKVEVLLQRGCFFCLVGRIELNKHSDEPKCLPKCSQLVHLGRHVGQHNALLASLWCPSSLKFGPRLCKSFVFMQSRNNQKLLKTQCFFTDFWSLFWCSLVPCCRQDVASCCIVLPRSLKIPQHSAKIRQHSPT